MRRSSPSLGTPLHPQTLRDAVRVRAGADSAVLTFLDGTTVEV
ncbi:hypothetical protein [Streptomyces sp. NPDC001880]